MTSVVFWTTEVVTTDLSPGRGSHQNDFIFLFQACIHPIQIANMRPIDEDIKVLSQDAFGVNQMEFNGWILFNHSIHYFLHCRSRHRKFGLIIDIIFHNCREADSGHMPILPCKQKGDGPSHLLSTFHFPVLTTLLSSLPFLSYGPR